MPTQEPNHIVIRQQQPFEIRRYTPMIIAQVALKGSMESISRNGFRMLANYIFGNNTGENGRSQKISMTAPVVLTKNTNE
jgi:hypothetical protein